MYKIITLNNNLFQINTV